jgi:carboxyl-terminal processing protease
MLLWLVANSIIFVAMNNAKTKIQIWLPLLLSAGMALGMLLGYKMRDGMPAKSFFELDKASPIQEVAHLIQSKYVDDVKSSALADTAIQAILSRLDPHSVFIPASELQAVNEDMAGYFFGIGVEYSIINDTIHVTQLMPGGPAARQGLQIGDKLLAANDSQMAGKKITPAQIKKHLRGKTGSEVRLLVLRQQQKLQLNIKRGIISISSVDAAYFLTPGLGYIKLNKFSQVTYREFMRALDSLKNKGLQQLILDLRGNGGGVLDEATAIADEFLAGNRLITYTEGRHFPKKEYRCKKEGLFEEGKLAILIDEGTASASEILAGSLQDWDRAIIAGKKSFGKGLVQEQYDLSDGSAVRLTIARYYTPLGRGIQRSYQQGVKAYFEAAHSTGYPTIAKDTAQLTAGKKFITAKGKILYEGGGITPDMPAIAKDSFMFNKLATELLKKGMLDDFAYLYCLNHKTALSSYKSAQEIAQRFVVDDKMWAQFCAMAQKDSLLLNKLTAKEIEELKKAITASICRQLWRNEGLYQFLNSTDPLIIELSAVLQKR